VLLIPSVDQFNDVTIYQDSAKDFVFYVMPNAPTLRKDSNGKNVFEFLKYREDASTVKEGASAGGGYIQFDCEFHVPDDQLKKITDKLQERVNQKYSGRSGSPPQVQVAQPTWVDGSIQLLTFEAKPDGSGMISHTVTGGKPSLIGSNIASFSTELTQRGAALMWQACQMANMPIAVVYKLKFLAQTPSLNIHGYLYTRQFQQHFEEITKQIDESVWGDTNEDYKKTVQDTFSKFGISGVDVIGWNLGTDPDAEKFKTQMVQQVWSSIQDQFKEATKDKFAPTPADTDGGSYEHQMRKYTQTATTDIHIYINQNQVIPWEINPQATMQGFLSGKDGAGQAIKKDDYFKEISLDDPFFKMLKVSAYCNADFANDPIYSVKLHIQYGQTVQDFLFRDASTVGVFQQYIEAALGNKYTYSAVVAFKNSDKTLTIPQRTTDETRLVLSVQDMGVLKVNIMVGNFNWDAINTAQVHIRYSDTGRGVPMQEDMLKLDQTTPSQVYQRLTMTLIDRPYEYKVTYFLKDGQNIATEWKQETSPNLMINDIFADRLAVKLLASGGFDRIQKMVVDLSYDDSTHNYSSEKTMELSADQDFATWILPLWDQAPKGFKYRTTLIYKDSHSDQAEWKTASDSQTIIVGEIIADYLTVDFITDLIDFTTIRLVKLNLHYVDAANQIDAIEDVVFTAAKKTAPAWKLPIKNKALKQYTYKVTYYKTDGTHVDSAEITTKDGDLVLDPSVVATPV